MIMEISVVMSCFNSDMLLLKRSITSVLNQSFSKFELIIVDDGSKHPISNSINIIDSRVKFIRLDNSVGLGAALNIGIGEAKAELIARIDDDDIMFPDRLKQQYEYLMKNANIVCVGTRLMFKYGNKTIKYRKFPVYHDQIINDLLEIRIV